MNLFPLIVSLLVGLISPISRVIAADGPRPGVRPPNEVPAKQKSQRAEARAKPAATDSDALYQFMVAEDRVGITVADGGSKMPSPRPR